MPFGARDAGAAVKTRLRPDRAFQGLSAKMEAYALARFMGAAPSEAYREAYDCKRSSPDTISSHAQVLEADGRIVQRIRQLVDKRDAVTTLAPLVDRAFVMDGVALIASNEREKAGDRLRAYELLGKSAGIDLFRETTIVQRTERTPEDVQRELRDRLNALHPVIEGTSHPTPASPDAPGVVKTSKSHLRDE